MALLRSNEYSSGDVIFLVTCTNMSSISWYSFLAQDMPHFHKSSNNVFVIGKKLRLQEESKFPHFTILSPNDMDVKMHLPLSLLHILANRNDNYAKNAVFTGIQ